tara:strand:- start:459 stop:773 length:315 start_codon:yes stop_codon:yes gene_type:complete
MTTKLNYSVDAVALITRSAPLNQAKAADIAAQLGKSTRSVIAKAISLGVAYDVKKPTRKDGSPISRKADTVGAIAKALDMDASDLDGLAKAPAKALDNLLMNIS